MSRTRAALLAAIATTSVTMLACGSKSGSTPSGPSTIPEPPATLHDTMNAPGDQRIQNGSPSFTPSSSFPRAYDDVTFPTATTIRSVTWQGFYCDGRYQVPLEVPPADAKVFTLAVLEDRNDYPVDGFTTVPIYQFHFSPNEVREELEFSVLEGATTCATKFPAPFSFYTYTVTLPTPISFEAGRKYWLRIMAEDITRFGWYWRFGKQHNSSSALLIGFTTQARQFYDLAFSLKR